MALDFQNFEADASLFIYHHDYVLCYLLVYVDDLVITGNGDKFLSHVVIQLGALFLLKDIGDLFFFLGIEVIPTKFGLFISQHKYIRDLLSKTNMIDAKQVSTMLSISTSLKLIDGITSFDNSDFTSTRLL